jgi:hypothetical protein
MADYTVARWDDLEGYYNGLFKKARATLGVSAFGLSIIDIPAFSPHYPEHNHPSGQEEVIICVAGFGRMIFDESEEVFVDLEPGVMVRIGAKTKRVIKVGDEGLKAIAIGGTPGEPYKPLPYTELGALDPLQKRAGR